MAKKRIATFLGTQKGLSVIGSHCYAYSGLSASSTTEKNVLEFNSGDDYIVGAFTFTGGATLTTVTSGNTSVWRITLNGELIALVKTETTNEDMPSSEIFKIVLPPLTYIQIGLISDQNDGAMFNSASLTGRIYNA